MNILLWVLIGATVGWAISKTTHIRTRESRSAYTLLGIVGSVGAALIWGQVYEPVITWFDMWLVGLAALGALATTLTGYMVLRHNKNNKNSDKVSRAS